MSKFLRLFAPSLGGAAIVLGGAYFLADQFVADVPAPLRDRGVSPALAQAVEDAERAAAEAADDPVGGETPAIAAEPSVEMPPDTPESPATETRAAEAPALAPAGWAGDPMPVSVALDLGRQATPEEVAAWDIDVRPDGQGLPIGSGDVLTGEAIYTDRCSACHGVFGEAEGRWPVLAGGHGSLTNERPVKTIGSYWPYLSTVFDYVHRAMPFGEAQTLTPDETYAIVAQLLYLNDIVDEDFVLSNENFTEVRLPNEGNFFPDDRTDPEGELAAFSGVVCMSGCKDSVEITGRAAVVDVTPEDAAARKRLEAAARARTVGSEDGTPMPETPAEIPGTVPDPVAGGGKSQADLIAAGEAAFRKCKTCHQVGDTARNRTGPVLNDLFGRAAGSLDGFRYSGAMVSKGEAGLIWTEETLGAFLNDPRGYIKGTRMSFAGYKDAADVEAVIAYLKTFDG